ncbi:MULTISPECIES: hypothetical protein [Sorangium]|uniref:hypothetical protein n=1 Tax=Sorangium TaxID=39643 RepID=UPI003D9C4FF2
MTTIHILTHSMFRRLAHAVSPLLLCALPVGCIAGEEGALDEGALGEEAVGEATQALSSWVWAGWGTTTDLVGLTFAVSGQHCVLRGVTGHLGRGDTFPPGVPSTAVVDQSPTAFSNYLLQGHGGATLNNSMARVWANNPVFAGAVCLPGTPSGGGSWLSHPTTLSTPRPPAKVANLDPNHRRQCFLSGVSGTEFTWDNATDFARVVEVLVPDTLHPTAGWYIESNISHLSNINNWNGRVVEGLVQIDASCIDFASDAEIVQDSETSTIGFTTHIDIDWRTGVKACGLTGISGKFNSNDWDDGVMIEFPDTTNGTWKIKLNDGRSASWACVL